MRSISHLLNGGFSFATAGFREGRSWAKAGFKESGRRQSPPQMPGFSYQPSLRPERLECSYPVVNKGEFRYVCYRQRRIWAEPKITVADNVASTTCSISTIRRGLSDHVIALTEEFREQQPFERSSASAIDSAAQFDAGFRLCDTSALLDMVLLKLPSKNVSFAQRVKRRFNSVIAKSQPLLCKLLFEHLEIELCSSGIRSCTRSHGSAGYGGYYSFLYTTISRTQWCCISRS